MGPTKLNVVGARRVVGRFARRVVPPLGPIASFLYVLWTTVGLSNDGGRAIWAYESDESSSPLQHFISRRVWR